MQSIIDKLKISIAIISIMCIGIFSYLIYKNGINIHNTYNQQQYQYQNQSQLVVSMMIQQGGFEWKEVYYGDETNIVSCLNKLEPYQSLFAKIGRVSIYYPEIKKVK